MEVYRDYRRIEGYDNYVISNYGEVFNTTSGRILAGGINSNGYYNVILCKNDEKKNHKVHRLVATCFIDNPENKPFADHIDNNRTNNHILNLRWATTNENNYNQALSKKNTSGTKGVYWKKDKNKWGARIKHNKKEIHIGYYTNIEEAIKARQEKARELFGEFTNSCEKDDDN